MAPRRGPHNSSSHQDSLSPNASVPPRSTSPSLGFTQFLTKPAKWFSRSASGSKATTPAFPSEPRPSFGSGARKHKISQPTDPRPILDNYSGHTARSVLDLSIKPASPKEGSPYPPSLPSSPVARSGAQLGDLRQISRRAWSKSADDLSKVVTENFTPASHSFQEKIAEYRSRTDGHISPAPPISAPLPTRSSPTLGPGPGTRHPFPTFGRTSPSNTSPVRNAAPGLSISISSPVIEEGSAPKSQNGQSHVHIRSHSFTPKLPSKLSTPRFPQSPQRGGTLDRESDMRHVSQHQNQAQAQGTPTKPTFGFGFINHKSSLPADVNPCPSPTVVANRQTALLPPPIIIEPEQQLHEEPEPMDPRRTSQIVFCSGFVNRFGDLPTNFYHHHHHPTLQLSKGWKPFKLELKGSKLYFYKPPNDRTAAIKDLFPTCLVPPSLEDDQESQGLDATSDRDHSRPWASRQDSQSPTPGRKKRAYWGRRTHPDIFKGVMGQVQKGSFEALVHEAVFATSFFDSTSSEDERKIDDEANEDIKEDKQARVSKWREFAASILLCVPHIVPGGRLVFETEFVRCCSYLVSGSKDHDREEHKSRVAWLLNEYLRFHGHPADPSGWEDLKKETIPNVSLSAETFHSTSSHPASSSTQAVYHPSPLIGSGSVENSPIVNTFSPRPEDGKKMIPLLEALLATPPQQSLPHHPHPHYPHQHQSMRPGFPPPPPPGIRFPWALLFEEGLTKDLLLCLDPHLVARSLTLFHRSVLEQCPENVFASFLIAGQRPDTDETRQVDLEEISTKDASDFLFGNDDRPHWLTKLLLLQILGAETATHHPSSSGANNASSPGRLDDHHQSPSQQQTSRTHSRSDIISVWVKIGELCRASGDECSWKAILVALCSRPVARLAKVWKRVDPQAMATVQRWIFGKSGLNHTTKVGQPQVTPWGGDIKDRLNAEFVRSNEELMIKCDPLLVVVKLFESFRTSFELCPRKGYVGEYEVNDDMRKLVSFWREMANEGGGRGGTAVKFQRVEQFMSLSLAAEPRRKGLFEPYFWTRPSLNTPHTPLIPLLFPDPLPTLTLVDRSKLIRGRIDSDASESQYVRSLEAQFRQESGRQLHSLDNANKDFTKKLILGHGGTVIPVYDGNLLLVTQSGGFESAPNSRPSSKIPSRPESSVLDHGSSTDKPTISRNTSIRVKPSSSHGLERKTSMARRSSLPAVTHLSRSNLVTTEPSTDPPLRVLVQAGALNNLVNILVHGLENISVSVADDNGEMTLREGKTRELALDKVEFARVWWNVFRSFLTPYVFFELLRKIYLSHPLGPSSTDIYNSAMKRVGVLTTLHDWFTVGSGAQDVLDDAQLFSAVQAFLDGPPEVPSTIEFPAAQQALERLSETRKAVQIAFVSQIQRPTPSSELQSQRGQGGSRSARRRNTGGRDVPDLDRMDPEAFVENLEGMASAAFSNVTEEDLYVTADLLEVQSADRTGWFPQREATMSEDMVEIQTIYSQILEVEPSSLISELSQDSLYRLLPPGVRSCIRAYTLIRKWLISKLVAPRIGLRARQARIELLIQAIELARLRNTETPAAAQLIEQPCVRSFVEAVTTSALLSPEIRLHHRTWQSVALGRNCNVDSLSSLLHQPYVQSTSSQESLTADMGWLLERMIEIIAIPDVLEGSCGEGQQLINFDKRRHLCNLISKIPCIPSERKPPVEESIRRGFERLNIIEKEVASIQFDFRGIKEEASREASNPGINAAPSSRKSIRPFQKIVAIQIEKFRRDKHLRTRLQREKVQEQTRIERRDDVLNKAMRMRKPVANAHPHKHRNKKSMSAFLNFMRPLSSAFGADVPQIVPKRSAAELNFPATGKPSLVINVVDARVAQFINNERSYTFQLDTEDGGHYLLQAVNKREMNKWLETISRVTNTAAKRRLTYIGSSPKPQIADHIHSHPIVASRDPQAVFGVELEFLLRRETGSETIPPGTIPVIVEHCLSEIESRGLTEVGIYRIAGAATVINGLKDAYNRGESPVQSSTDIHAICDLVKSWFRVLPEPLFPPSSYWDAMEAMRQENLEDRLLGTRNVVQALPRANLDLLRRVSEHLDKVTDFEECNHMTAEALAIVFSPNLLRAPQNDFVMILNNMGLSHKLVKALITHFHFIFDEAEPDLEAPSEDELEETILEEEEEGADADAIEEEEETHDLMQDDKQHTTDNGNDNDST